MLVSLLILALLSGELSLYRPHPKGRAKLAHFHYAS